jgi:hypothetical protein
VRALLLGFSLVVVAPAFTLRDVGAGAACALHLEPGAARSSGLVAPERQPVDWLPTSAELRKLPAVLLAMLEADPYSYFRYVNKPWARRVCDTFRADLASFPRVRVHGDAHVEQYAFTRDEFGLDDFDDSAEGPSVVDLTRFIGSLELAVRRRGWTRELDRLVDDFFRGYLTALEKPDYRPATPAIVTRRRPMAARDRDAFLAWADSLMEPVAEDVTARARTSLTNVVGRLAVEKPGFPVERFALKKLGRLQLGIGSLLTPKLLLRVEGPTKAPGDDVILEAKALSDLTAVDCLIIPPVQEALRVVDGSQQIGRIKHELLSLVPGVLTDDPVRREWWIRSWEASYGEIDVDHFDSTEELREVAHDAGAQLGSTNLPVHTEGGGAIRAREHDAVVRMQSRIRAVARSMSHDVVEGWEALQR